MRLYKLNDKIIFEWRSKQTDLSGYDVRSLPYILAEVCEDVLETDDAVDPDIFGFTIEFNAFWRTWTVVSSCTNVNEKIFKHKTVAEAVAKLLNNNKKELKCLLKN